jgi:hypothetical protein
MKRASEGEFGKALRDCDVAGIVYKPPDDARTWKPCDFMVWVQDNISGAESVWFECKDVDSVERFAFSELRPSQVQGIRDAERVGIPYWLAVYWRRSQSWTISDAAKVLAWRESTAAEAADYYKRDVGLPTSIERELLMSRFGIDSSPAMLASTLKSVLLGDI